ncbi:MAG TPA: oligosaccharide flippase family protein [Steroidobacteraceae bacterium]|nr:oligosaccharide flippase family protein [Steroidobacteraceae bacterium]
MSATTAATVERLSTRELDRKAASSLAWQIGKVAVQLVQYVLLARLVSPAEFGIFLLAIPLYTVLAAINDGGLSTASVTGTHYDSQLASTLWWTQVGLGFTAALVMAASSPLLAALFDTPQLLSVSLWLSCALLIRSFGLQSRARLRRDMRVARIALVDIGGMVAGLAGAAIATQWLGGVEVLVLAQILSALAANAIACASAPTAVERPRFTREYLGSLRVGWHVVGSDLLSIVRAQAPTLIIGSFLSVSALGLFNRAYQLLTVPTQALSPAMGNFLLPLLSRTRDRPDEFRSHLRRGQRLFLCAAIPLSVWIAAGPRDLIIAALGPVWAGTVPILQCLTPLFVSQVMASVARNALLAADHAATERTFSFWNLVLTIAATLAAAPFGVIAFSLALSLSGLLLRAPLLAVLAVRKGALHADDLIDGVRVMLLLAAIGGTLLWVLEYVPMHAVVRDLVGLVCVLLVSLQALRIVRRRADARPAA